MLFRSAMMAKMAEGFDFSCDLRFNRVKVCFLGLELSILWGNFFWCFFLFLFSLYIYVKEFDVMLKVLVDLLWWMGFIFGDLYGGGCKTMAVGWIFENCNWWVCGLLEVVETENGRRKVSMFQAS